MEIFVFSFCISFQKELKWKLSMKVENLIQSRSWHLLASETCLQSREPGEHFDQDIRACFLCSSQALSYI